MNINPAVRQTIFFGSGAQNSFKGYGVVDFAATYTVPVWRAVAPWLKVELYNALNNQKQIAWDRTVSVDQNSARDANGIPTGYLQGPRTAPRRPTISSRSPILARTAAAHSEWRSACASTATGFRKVT